MEEKHILITKTLLESNSWITASVLSTKLNVSIRTVKNYVSEINSAYPGLVYSSGKGYRVNTEVAAVALSEEKKHLPQTLKERTIYIIKKVLRTNQDLSIIDLCDELFISMSTIRTVIKRAEKRLNDFDLTLETGGDSLHVTGSERNRRRMLSELLYEESNTNFIHLDVIQDYFETIDVDYISNTLSQTLSEHHYFVNDFCSINIVLHVVIAIDRIMNQLSEYEPHYEYKILPGHIHELTQDFINKLEEYFHIKFSPPELYSFSLLLFSRITTLETEALTDESLEKYVGKKTLGLVMNMLNLLKTEYQIDLYDHEFLIRFSLHIKNLLLRTETKSFNRNPLTESIKFSCPLIYDISVRLCSFISQQTQTNIIDDEIAYVAFHIGNALETQRAYASRISVVLNCPSYYNIDQNLYLKLMEHFSKDIVINAVTASEVDLDKYSNVDLVLSTVPVRVNKSAPTIIIKPFLTLADISLIERSISDLKQHKKQKSFMEDISTLMKPEFFERIDRVMTKEEVIHHICSKLTDLDYCSQEFETDVLTRETLSSTAFFHFAIPHSLHMNANQSCIYVLINEQPVQWDQYPIQLILLLCFRSSDNKLFTNIFEPLSMSLLNGTNMKSLLSCQNYENFIKTLVHSFSI